MRRLALVLGVMAAVLVSGVAAASVFADPGSSPSPVGGLHPDGNASPAQAEDAGIHGGPVERFHGSGPCSLTAVSALPGNWTHGDQVSTVAAAGDPAIIQAAARSDCGKPMVAVEHGGPPAHALAHIPDQARDHVVDHIPGASAPGPP